MKYFAILCAAILLCAAAACEKSATVSPSATEITGRWRWVKSVGGIGGTTLTPSTEGFSQSQVFQADSTFKIYRNDTLKLQGRFTIRHNVIYRGTTVDLLKVNDLPDRSLSVRNDTLYTYDLLDDGYGEVYVRVR